MVTEQTGSFILLMLSCGCFLFLKFSLIFIK